MQLLRVSEVVLACLLACGTVSGQTMTARELVGQRTEWEKWAAANTRMQINGRFEGRVARQLRMERVDITFYPGRGTILPSRIESGQRMTISGLFRKSGEDFQFQISSLLLHPTDREMLYDRADRVPVGNPEELYSVADTYQEIADFYEDEGLQRDIDSLRTEAFRTQRRTFRNDGARLRALAQHGTELKLNPRLIAAVRFEAIVAEVKSGQIDEAQLVTRLKSEMPGWDSKGNLLSPQKLTEFQNDPVAQYEDAADLDRSRMHREFYRQYRRNQLLETVSSDGSNGNQVAEQIRSELPEDEEIAAMVESRYVEFRLQQVDRLTRSQLEDLTSLLHEHNRSDDVSRTVNQWLSNQRTRFKDRGATGAQRIAEEFLFAHDKWKDPAHLVEATDHLKRAWAILNEASPRDAQKIEQRLNRLGWTRLHDQWMTGRQIRSLPKSDVELAIREGRIVAGMTPEQIRNTHGTPSRRVRIASAVYVDEIWVFEIPGASGITVHLRRSRHQEPEEARAMHVAQLPSSFRQQSRD